MTLNNLVTSMTIVAMLYFSLKALGRILGLS